jgi:RNA polymerase sigma factor for flagellar operon FliA
MRDDEREAQVRALLPLLRKIAKRVNRLVPGSDLGDLVGDGSIGLVRAVDAYDPSHGIPLEAYARRLMLGAILNGLRRMDPVSERVRQVVRDAERERYRLAVVRGEMPTEREMLRLHPALERAKSCAHHALPLSLDAPLPRGERVARDTASDPAALAVENDERAYLRALVEDLPERQRRVMLAHYYHERSLRAIGRTFHISSQRASQIHLCALGQLRRRLDVSAYRA